MLHITQTPDVIERLRTRGPQIIEELTRKMLQLMFRLQSKIVGETIPAYFPSGSKYIAASVRDKPPTATAKNNLITGAVEGGGPQTTKVTLGGPNAGQLVDYAEVQEEGVYHSWVIEPVFFTNAWAINQKERATGSHKVKIPGGKTITVEGLPKALAFLFNGKQMILRRVLHPGLKARPFMQTGLDEMSDTIVAELEAKLNELLS